MATKAQARRQALHPTRILVFDIEHTFLTSNTSSTRTPGAEHQVPGDWSRLSAAPGDDEPATEEG